MKKRKSKEKKYCKKLSALIVLIITFSLIYVVEGELLKSYDAKISSTLENIVLKQNEILSTHGQINLTRIDIVEKQSEINSTKEQLNLKEAQLEGKESELQQLKSGDNYQLHDPLFKEVEVFLNQDNNYDEWDLVKNAKSQGIQCAYVQLYTDGGGLHPVVGFNTLDEGLVYFEAGTDYCIIPEIGKTYTSCFVDEHYYSSSFDSITDIVFIW